MIDYVSGNFSPRKAAVEGGPVRPRRTSSTCTPEPHVPYRVLRVGDRHAVLGYADARLGFPSLVGFEIQDARARAALLGDDPVLGNLLAIPCLVGERAEPVPLSWQLASLLGC